MYVFGTWEEAQVREESPRMHTENVSTEPRFDQPRTFSP